MILLTMRSAWLRMQFYNKKDDYNFLIVNFPFPFIYSRNILAAPIKYGVSADNVYSRAFSIFLIEGYCYCCHNDLVNGYGIFVSQCSICPSHNLVFLSSFVTCQRIFNQSNVSCATSGAETA